MIREFIDSLRNSFRSVRQARPLIRFTLGPLVLLCTFTFYFVVFLLQLLLFVIFMVVYNLFILYAALVLSVAALRDFSFRKNYGVFRSFCKNSREAIGR